MTVKEFKTILSRFPEIAEVEFGYEPGDGRAEPLEFKTMILTTAYDDEGDSQESVFVRLERP